MLSLVIPTLQAEDVLATMLAALVGRPPVDEVVVADGGSTDATRAVARRWGARVVTAPRGRGPQLAAGARSAQGDWLLFLHADTVPGDGWREAVTAFMAEPSNADRAAVFRLALDDEAPAARRLERMVSWRTRALGLPYGDQGLLVSRPFYDALGGFRPLPLMEDVDIMRRIGKRRLTVLDAAAKTSATRYRKDGYIMRPVRNLTCLGLYFLGVPTPWLKRLYG